MKIAFFQREWFENIGIMTLAAVIKEAGFPVDIFVQSAEKNFISAVKSYAPDLACFSCTSGEHLWALETAKKFKDAFRVFTIFGGHHPTFFPEIIENAAVDAVCRGEGEWALLELAQALESNRPITAIANLWIKDKGRVVKNNLRPLIGNLDGLALPLRSLYDKYPQFQKNPTKHFMASRGCPSSCSYCYAQGLRELYRGKGTFVRYRSAEHVLNEIKAAKENYPLRTVFFDDDIFTFNKKWLFDLLEKYKREIARPFICNVWAGGLSDEVCRKLKEAGCFRVSMGVETGNEKLRTELLSKNISNEQIIQAAENLHHNDIKFLTNNMIGLPGETVDQACETIRLNIRIKTDYPWCSILQPYPKTPIQALAAGQGLLEKARTDSFSATFFKDSPLKQKNIRELIRLQKFFYLAVNVPAMLPLIRLLIKLPLGPLYEIIFLVSFAHRYRKANRLSFLEIAMFSLKNMTLYLKRSF